MNVGLLYLLRRKPVGGWRWLRRQLRTVKGALGFGFAVLYLGGVMAMRVFGLGADATPPTPTSPERLLTLGPLLVMGMTILTAASGRALSFAPAEVDFLFAAPVSRRQLLLYHWSSRLGAQLFAALFVSIFFTLQYAAHWPLGLLAGFMMMVFIYTVAQALSLGAIALTARLRPGIVRLLAVAVAAAGAVYLLAAVRAFPASAGVGERVLLFLRLPLLRTLSLPARPVVELLLAPDLVHALLWLGVSLAVIVLALAVMIRADVAFTEHALAASRKMAERAIRMRSGGSAFAAAGPSRVRMPVPRLGFLGTAGGLARRQMLEATRNPKPIIGLAGFMTLVAAMPLILEQLDTPGALPSPETARMVLGFVLALPLMATAYVPFDFRADLDRMAYLKTLPLSERAVVAGQIFTPALILWTLQAVGIVALTALTGVLAPLPAAALLLALPPLVWVVVAIDNGVFLLSPYRLSTSSAENLQFFGRSILTIVVKMLALAAVALPAALVAWLVHRYAGHSLPLAAAAGALVLAALCLPLTTLVARVYAAFDVSLDVPA